MLAIEFAHPPFAALAQFGLVGPKRVASEAAAHHFAEADLARERPATSARLPTRIDSTTVRSKDLHSGRVCVNGIGRC